MAVNVPPTKGGGPSGFWAAQHAPGTEATPTGRDRVTTAEAARRIGEPRPADSDWDENRAAPSCSA
ncbi:hypothetical protein GCM10009680_75480 [Streptomyces yatensis]|uniref:Uncharacterized protein n=1 Tax=Streptomyces yatensis TaxID=155177 RepID=A0ABN2JCP6_9ACTN